LFKVAFHILIKVTSIDEKKVYFLIPLFDNLITISLKQDPFSK